MKEYKITLIGFGGVNKALAELIAERNDEWKKTLGFGLKIVGVSDLFLGSVIAPNGIEPSRLLRKRPKKGSFSKFKGGSEEARSIEVIRDAPADIVVEATFTDPRTGEPAISFCKEAFKAGRSVVTTNKGPVALAGAELINLASSNGVGFEFEGTVMSGTPVIRAAKDVLAGVGLKSFMGIMNGTSNYVLGRMEDGLTLTSAIGEAQEKGYAEANPSADIDGVDVKLKVAILAQQLFNMDIKPDNVSCYGIRDISLDDIKAANDRGEKWKLIGGVEVDEGGTAKAFVGPRKLPGTHPLASVSGATNAISFATELMGDLTISGAGAGRIETAYALLSDINALHKNPRVNVTSRGLA